jgi:hypothetical protein
MGILLEADYKGVVSGRESPIKGLQRAFSSTKQGTQNPLEAGSGEKLRCMESDGQLTYEVMNRDTGKFSRRCAEDLRGELILWCYSGVDSTGIVESKSPYLCIY